MANRNLTLALQNEDKPTVEDIASDLFTNDDGVPYTDLLAVGANPTAKIYRDGTVIGSTDNGNYKRWANGDLEFSIIPSIDLTQDSTVAQSQSLPLIVYSGKCSGRSIAKISSTDSTNKAYAESTAMAMIDTISTNSSTVNFYDGSVTSLSATNSFAVFFFNGRWKA